MTCIRQMDELHEAVHVAWSVVQGRPSDEVGSTNHMLVTSDGFYLVATKGNGAAGKSPEAVMPMLDVRQVAHVHTHTRHRPQSVAWQCARTY